MPLFRYEAQDKTGKTVVGAMQVADEAALQRRLTAMGYLPVTVQPASAPAAPQGRAVGCDQPVSSQALALLYEELYTTVRAGIPLGQALASTAAVTPHAGLRKAVADLGRGVEAGAPLAKVLLRYPMMFRAGDRGLLAAGEQGGFVDQALRLLADRHEADRQLQPPHAVLGLVSGRSAVRGRVSHLSDRQLREGGVCAGADRCDDGGRAPGARISRLRAHGSHRQPAGGALRGGAGAVVPLLVDLARAPPPLARRAAAAAGIVRPGLGARPRAVCAGPSASLPQRRLAGPRVDGCRGRRAE